MTTKRAKKSKPKKGKKHMMPSEPKKPVTPEHVEVKPAAKAVIQEEGSNSDPTKVGGLQPIYCPQCNKEVAKDDSYHLSLDNKRYHYPTCWQKHELGL